LPNAVFDNNPFAFEASYSRQWRGRVGAEGCQCRGRTPRATQFIKMNTLCEKKNGFLNSKDFN